MQHNPVQMQKQQKKQPRLKQSLKPKQNLSRLEMIGDSLKEFPFTKTFYGSHNGETAIEDATRLFKDQKVMVIAVVAGDHKTSTYIKNH